LDRDNAQALEIGPYDLPDTSLLEVSGRERACVVFEPERVLVVVGKGSDVERELQTEHIVADGVPVLRRGSGGCAVVLTPGMMAVAFALYTREQRKSSEYFQTFNRAVIRALEECGVRDLEHAGISDIARAGRKIAGSAIYRNRELLFYHSIVNLAGETALIERYLRQPPRMPDYRAERSHADFVTSLQAEGFAVNRAVMADTMQREFEKLFIPQGTPAT